MKFIVAALLSLIASAAYAKPYAVDYTQSSVTFAGSHAENAFTGEFKDWTADIEFDPAFLDKSHFNATFKTASATTGNKMYDGTLPQADWFNSAKFPEAKFVSSGITQNSDGSYLVKGKLTIRDITLPKEFSVVLSDVNQSPITAESTFGIDRLAYHIGKNSDGQAEWVSKDISVSLNIVAKPK